MDIKELMYHGDRFFDSAVSLFANRVSDCVGRRSGRLIKPLVKRHSEPLSDTFHLYFLQKTIFGDKAF